MLLAACRWVMVKARQLRRKRKARYLKDWIGPCSDPKILPDSDSDTLMRAGMTIREGRSPLSSRAVSPQSESGGKSRPSGRPEGRRGIRSRSMGTPMSYPSPIAQFHGLTDAWPVITGTSPVITGGSQPVTEGTVPVKL